MAMTSYLKISGESQGDIKGDCTQKDDKAETILVYGFDHKVEIPTDTHTGLPTGSRIHKPYEITIHKGKYSPMLFQACCNGEQMTVEHLFYQIKPDGTEEQYYTIKLEKAIIVTMKEFNPLTFLEEGKLYHDMEKIAMTYKKITWEHASGVAAEDGWDLK